MNGLPYYKAYPRDFIEGTIGMPFEIKCAYRVVLDLIYMQGGDLPNDDRYVAGLLGCSVRKWVSIREALIDLGKIYVSGGFLRNYRADNELETVGKYQRQQTENGTKPKKNKVLRKPSLKPNPNQPEPEPEPDKEGGGGSAREALDHEAILLAAGVDPSKDVTGKWHSSSQIWEAQRWRDDLGLTGEEILATIAESRNGKVPGSLAYFTPAMQRAAGRKIEPKLKPIEGEARPPPNRIDVAAVLRAQSEASRQ